MFPHIFLGQIPDCRSKVFFEILQKISIQTLEQTERSGYFGPSSLSNPLTNTNTPNGHSPLRSGKPNFELVAKVGSLSNPPKLSSSCIGLISRNFNLHGVDSTVKRHLHEMTASAIFLSVANHFPKGTEANMQRFRGFCIQPPLSAGLRFCPSPAARPGSRLDGPGSA